MTDLHADAANGEVVPAPGASTAGAVTTFSFGDPMPVLDSRGLLDYLECCRNGRYYEPPIFLSGLSRTTCSNPFLQWPDLQAQDAGAHLRAASIAGAHRVLAACLGLPGLRHGVPGASNLALRAVVAAAPADGAVHAPWRAAG